jgi:hypothetical protein
MIKNYPSGVIVGGKSGVFDCEVDSVWVRVEIIIFVATF